MTTASLRLLDGGGQKLQPRLHAFARRHVGDDREEQEPLLQADGTRVDLHLTDLTGGQTVAEGEEEPSLPHGIAHGGEDRRGGGDVHVGDGQAADLFMRIAVKLAGRGGSRPRSLR